MSAVAYVAAALLVYALFARRLRTTALTGAISYVWHGWGQANLPPFSLGYVNLLVAVLIAPATIVCARAGVRLASRLSRDKLTRAFAWFIIIVGIYMAVNAYLQ